MNEMTLFGPWVGHLSPSAARSEVCRTVSVSIINCLQIGPNKPSSLCPLPFAVFMSNPSSLRDLYGTNPPSWSFTPPSIGPSSRPPPPPQTSNISSYTFPSRPAQNSIFELSPALAEPGGLDLGLLLKTLIASAVLGYTTAAIAMPWEVGKCLLQVQWVPRDAEQVDDSEEPATEEVAEDVCLLFSPFSIPIDSSFTDK
jgi:fusion and transport protein UGO1